MKESSIEEDTIILGAFNLAPSIQHISGIEFKGVQKAIDNLLSDYKRVLEENEILKKEKEQAWEEWNNLEQGSYETEQKLKQQIKTTN